jgi:hypothetical protein
MKIKEFANQSMRELDPSIPVRPAGLVRSIRYEQWNTGKDYLYEHRHIDRIKVGEHFGWNEQDDCWEFWVIRTADGDYIQRVIRNGIIYSQEKWH